MLRFGLYARKSDDDPKVTEKSITDQIDELTALAERDKLLIVKQWQESRSAKVPHRRSGWDELMELVKQGKINGILCWQINRLVRNMEEGGQLVQYFIEGKIQEIRTPYSIHRTGDNILPLVIEAATATQYSLDHTVNVNRGMKSKFQNGGVNYRAPQGYLNARNPDNSDIGIVIRDPDRFELIRKAWDLLLTGSYSVKEIVNTLNKVWGYRTRKTPKTGGIPLSNSAMYTIFQNPFYAGFVRQYSGGNGRIRSGQPVLQRGKHEAMITVEEFSRAQEVLDRHSYRHPITYDFPYTGMMKCGYCGQQVTASQKRGLYLYYHCSNTYGKCDRHGMPEIDVEKKILNTLANITLDEDMCQIALNNIARDLDRQTEPVHSLYSQQHNTLQDIEKKLDNLENMWIQGLMTDENRYRSKQSELYTERDNLMVSAEKCRQELETMRANARASGNYVMFARENFMVGNAQKKREIAKALGLTYTFYGREKRIDIEIHPLLVEIVRYAKSVAQASDSLEMSEREEMTTVNEKRPIVVQSVYVGGP